MTESRIYVDMDLREGASFTLPPTAHQHLVVVLHRSRGDSITLFNGRGGEYGATIEKVARREVSVRVHEFREICRESPVTVTLAQAVSKGERMDYTIQKAVELGIAGIQPLITDHVVVRLSEERWQRKQEHWQNVAISACEQSGRTRVPKVAPVRDLRDWLAALPAPALKLALTPGGTASAAGLKYTGQPVVLLAGPEGGFSETELKLAGRAGFTGLSLGPRVLRTETAGMVALSVIQSLWGDLSAPLNKGN